MEMYADEEARGGVLEPEGIVGIKFRKDKQLDTMARLDKTYGDLKAKLADTSLTADQQAEVKDQMHARESLLLPVYGQISIQYADLHDRAGRMQAKGAIRMPLSWKNARRFFYWRLRRRTNEEEVLRRMSDCTASVGATGNSPAAAHAALAAAKEKRITHLAKLAAWTGLPDNEFDIADEKVAKWYESHMKDIASKLESMKTEAVAADVATLLQRDRSAGLKGVAQILSTLPVAEKEELLKQLSK